MSDSEEQEEYYATVADSDEELEDAEDQQEEEGEDEDEDEEGDQLDLSEYQQMQYLAVLERFLSRGGRVADLIREPEVEEQPAPMNIDISDTAIAHQIRNDTRGNLPSGATNLLLKREINMKCPFTPTDKAHLLQNYVPRWKRRLYSYEQQIFGGQYSKDGTIYMTACQDKRIRLYDAESEQLKKEIHARNIGWSIIDTDYSPDQRWLIYSSWSDYVHFCNISGDFEIHDALDFKPEDERFCLFSIKFSPNSSEILGGSSDRHLYLYDIERKDRVMRVEAHDDDINTVCYLDAQGNLMASGSDDHLIKIWDRRLLAQSGQPVGVLEGHDQGITHVSTKGDGRYLISNGKDQSIKLWDIRRMENSGTSKPRRMGYYDYRYGNYMSRRNTRNSKDVSIQTYRGHKVLQTLIRAYFSPSATTGQKYIYTGSSDGVMYIYDVLTGEICSQTRGHTAIIRDLSWHPHKPEITTTSWDGYVCRWSATEEKGATLIQSKVHGRT